VDPGSFPGVKRLGHGIDHPPPSSAEVKERVELYLYLLPLWAFMVSSRMNFTFTLLLIIIVHFVCLFEYCVFD
jgi:hypothetical protein